VVGEKTVTASILPGTIDLPNRIDVVDRDSPASLLRIVEFVTRLRDNLRHTVLVLYPESPERERIMQLLGYYQLNLLVAASYTEALGLLEQQPEIRLAVVGSHLGTMSGEEVLRCLRSTYDYERLAILGLSEKGDKTTAQNYLKSGANDFLLVPFVLEEFYCRVLNMLRGVDLVERLSQAATRDHLTGLHNRRFLYDIGSKLFASSVRRQISISVAMVDIDHFKAINDTFGHEAGNIVLRRIAQILSNRFRKTDIVARVGGEEFAILMVNMSEAGMHECFEALKEKVAAESFIFNGIPVQVTVSIGVYDQSGDSLQDLLDSADRLLYIAKSNGRNRIEYASSLVRC
jgi:diguanylate cyclase (GGDEF)-like protein